MRKKTKILLIALIVALAIGGTIFYLRGTNRLVLCPEGQLKAETKEGNPFCYTPSGKDGEPCQNAEACGTAGCKVEDESKPDQGVCRDLRLDCGTWLSKDGEPVDLCWE